MKLSQSYFYTLRQAAKDEDTIANQLLVRAGFIQKSSSGVYILLPLGLKTINNIQKVIREEMEAIESQEVAMPALVSEETFIASGRRDNFGASMFAFKDRNNKPFVLAPTHEELFAIAARMVIRSHKDLPISLFQFQRKYRDEPRPRFGLIRVKEFIMKDAYTFDKSIEALDISYQKMFQAYKNIFNRLALDYVIVNADTGVMGGLLSQEFQAISDIGEDILVIQEESNYASNLEVAGCVVEKTASEEHLSPKNIATPKAKTIEEVVAFLKEDIKKFVKTLIYVDDQKRLYAILCRGDHEINETKLTKLLKVNAIQLADRQDVENVTQAPVGFAGPIGLNIPIIADQQVLVMHNFICGANQADTHTINVNIEDFTIRQSGDIRNIKEGDLCENKVGPVTFKRGIEVGNTFKLGDKYSKALNLYYTDQNNQLQPVIMGSYGIGLERTMAAIVQQHHSENAILWPKEIAPIQVAIVIANMKDEAQVKVANELYEQLKALNIEVLLDDRDERIGVKFKDMELIGAYSRITVGKALSENQVEFVSLAQSNKELIPLNDIIQHIQSLFL